MIYIDGPRKVKNKNASPARTEFLLPYTAQVLTPRIYSVTRYPIKNDPEMEHSCLKTNKLELEREN